MSLKWFSDSEVAGLKEPLPQMLDTARDLLGQPIILTSTTGGIHTHGSEHPLGLAADIGLGHIEIGFMQDSYRWSLMKALFTVGFQRIECAPDHVHVGIGTPPAFPAPVFWIGIDT